MLGGIGGRRKRGRQRMSWLDGITDSMDVNLSKLQKMIQNLESKMELQINRLETKIEKMQEMFNKDLDEIKRVNQ